MGPGGQSGCLVLLHLSFAEEDRRSHCPYLGTKHPALTLAVANAGKWTQIHHPSSGNNKENT